MSIVLCSTNLALEVSDLRFRFLSVTRLGQTTILLPSATKLRRLCFYTCLSVHGGGCTWAGIPPRQVPLWDQVHPPGPGTPPWDQVHHPQGRYTPRAGTPWDQVHPPGPGTPPGTRYTPRTRYPPPGQVHPPGPGTPPADGYCCGRYASYWNAFLFCHFLS